MKQVRLILAVVATTALVAAACTSDGDSSEGGAGGSGEPVTLDFWIFNEIATGDFYEELVKRFEAEHPNVNIELTTYPEENYDIKLETAIAAGKEPDLILSFGPDYPRQGLLLPIDDALAQAGVDLSTFSKSIVSEGGEFSCGWGGKLYCIGSYSGISAMLYNKDMFDAAGIEYPAPWPPMTTDEFVDIACQLMDPEHQVWGGGAADPMSFLPWEVYVSDDGRTTEGIVNGPEVVHEFDTLARGYKDQCFPSLNVLDPWEQGRDFFAKGQLGMVVTDWLDLDKVDKSGINWGTTAPPTPAGEDPYFFSWSDGVAVMASTDNPEEAKELVALVATDGQKIRFETTGDIPLDSKVAEEVDWAGGDPGREDGLEVATHARASMLIPDRWTVFGPLWDAWGFIVGGDKTAQQALDDEAPAMQQNLDEAWETWEDQG